MRVYWKNFNKNGDKNKKTQGDGSPENTKTQGDGSVGGTQGTVLCVK